MPRMYDILRNTVPPDGINKEGNKVPPKDAPKKEGEGKKAAESYLNFPKGILTREIARGKKAEDHSLMSKRLIEAVKQHGVDNMAKSEEIYKNTVEVVNVLLEKIRQGEDVAPYMDEIYEVLDDVFNQIVLGDSILDNIYEKRKNVYYLPYHIVNVLLLASVIGMSMGLNKSHLSHLGFASIFYDLGIDTMGDILSQPRKLTKEEHNLVKSHISKSLRIIENIGVINKTVRETIEMHHERINGNGYPAGIKADSINIYARIIGLVDTYEAITNDRPHREGMNAHKAIRFILGPLKDYFAPEVMKVFINKMSIYPIGSIVKLNTHELARVISVQPGSPLRPVVIIIQDAFGKSLKERTIVDLSKQDFPSIQDSV
ncbi:MAG: HD domain-containing protein [Candidatus Omnitrophica bacterium]|nr:HD domain-containing protein [Candidatus Omnitrophota bacterium]